MRVIPSSPLTLHHLGQTRDPALGSWEQESCPCPSLAAALRKVGPVPCLGITVELTLVARAHHLGGSEREQDSPLVCWVVVQVRKRCRPPLRNPSPSTVGQESQFQGRESRRAGPNPHQLQPLGEQLCTSPGQQGRTGPVMRGSGLLMSQPQRLESRKGIGLTSSDISQALCF